MENARATHHQTPSINSLGSIVEPLTPPDLSEQFVLTQSSSQLSAADTPSASTTPLSSLNTSIGGNTFRSRFKSLPLVTELDYKFNQLNINNLQKLSSSTTTQSPTFGTAASTTTIPQISLQHYQALEFSSDQERPSPHKSSSYAQPYHHHQQCLPRQHFQQHHSLPAIHLQQPRRESSSSNSSLSFKNHDELSLIPIEKLDIIKLSMDQYGCRFLQKKLEVDNSIKDIIFTQAFNNVIELIVDPFGNYLIQKLVDYLSTYQKNLLVEKIHPYLFMISVNQYGTRSLQKIIDRVSNTYQMDLIVRGLQMNDPSSGIEDNNVVRLIKDLNGNHVIQKCIFKFPPEKFQFIIDSICLNDNIVRISTHKHGCCVLQKLLNNANFDQILKISRVLLVFLDELINDQFGNYIIQFLFELDFLKSSSKIDFLIDDFFSKMYRGIIQLSCLKFSSNVIEKFIKILKTKKNYFYLNEIIRVINSNFEALIKDKFGNYVIQTLIDQFYDVAELNAEMSILINTAKNYLPVIKAAPYARKIQLKIQQLELNCNTVPYTGSSILQAPYFNPSFDKQACFGKANSMNIHHNFNHGPQINKRYVPYIPDTLPVTDTSRYHNPNALIPDGDYVNPAFINSG